MPPPAAPAWRAPTTALGVVCGQDKVRLWAGDHSTLAGIGTARVWRSTDGGANWTAIPLGAVPTAYVDDPSHPASAWVATSTGVSEIVAGVPQPCGDRRVRSPSVASTGGSPTLFAVSNGQVHRFVDAATGWTSTATLPGDAVAREVVAFDADSFVVGTDKGVVRSDDGGTTYGDLQGAGVVGAPARSGAVVSWLLADHTGVLRNTGPGGTWISVPAPGIAPDATALTFVPALGLVTTGADSALVSSLDGAAWVPLKDQPPFRPDGIARAGTVAGTTVWTSKCGQAGQPAAADAVLRLAN